MNMKKALSTLTILIISGSMYANSGELERIDKKTVKNMTETEMQDRAEVLEDRLTEIQAMDIDALDRSDRKSLKKELRYINREMTALGNGGIYLSTGAVIIIILLLILIL
jgi:hypothetical protein